MVTLNFVLNASIRLGELDDGLVADRLEDLFVTQRRGGSWECRSPSG